MPADDLVAGASLHQLGVPVHIVGGNLYEFKLRVLRQYAVQQLRGGMEREAQVFDLPLRLPLQRVLDQMLGLYDAAFAVIAIVPAGLEVVQQVVIHIVHAQPVQLFLKDVLDLVLVAGLQVEGGKLGGDADGFAGVALHHGLAHGLLTPAVVVDVGGVEVVVARRQVGVHHFIQLFIVEIRRVAVLHGQAHHAKAQS